MEIKSIEYKNNTLRYLCFESDILFNSKDVCTILAIDNNERLETRLSMACCDKADAGYYAITKDQDFVVFLETEFGNYPKENQIHPSGLDDDWNRNA